MSRTLILKGGVSRWTGGGGGGNQRERRRRAACVYFPLEDILSLINIPCMGFSLLDLFRSTLPKPYTSNGNGGVGLTLGYLPVEPVVSRPICRCIVNLNIRAANRWPQIKAKKMPSQEHRRTGNLLTLSRGYQSLDP